MNKKTTSLAYYSTLAILCVLYGLLLATCSAPPSPIPTNSATTWTATPRRTPTPSQTATIPSTPTVTRTATNTPRPTATQDISPRVFTTLGQGKLGDLARSPDGKLIVLTEGENLRWFDAANAEEIGSVNLGDSELGYITFSPSSRWIVVSSGLGAQLVDTITQNNVKCCEGGQGFSTGFNFSADSRYLAYRGVNYLLGGPLHFVGVFDLETLQYTEIQGAENSGSYGEGYQSYPYPVLNPDNYHTMSNPFISPNNQWLAAGYHDSSHNLLYIWNLLTGETRFAIPHPAEVISVDFSPDGRYLATGCDDGLVRLFNPLTGKLVRTLTGFLDSITHVRFSADGRQITVYVYDQPDQVYDLAANQIEPLITPKTTPDPFLISMYQQGYADGDGVLFSPDGHSLATGGQTIQLWDISSKSVIALFENPYSYLLGWVFSPDGADLAGITQNGDVLVWDVSSEEMILTLTSEMLAAGQVYYAAGGGNIGPGIGAGVFTDESVAFSPDNAQLAFGNGNAIEIWDIASASKISSLVQPKAPAYATRVSFSADGKRLYAVINRNRDAQVWDVQTGLLLKQLNLPNVDPNAFSATALNGPLFARNNYDDTGYWVELWNLDTGEMVKLPTLARETEPLLFSPDGNLLIAISEDHLYFWKTDRGQLVKWMNLDTSSGELAISPDNAILAIGQEGKIQLYDISALRDAAAQEKFTPAVPPPTATPSGDYYTFTKTPFHTQAVTFPTPSTLPEGAISPENAAQIRELSHFGNGTLSEIIWSTSPNIPTITLISAGSQGVFTYGSDPLTETVHLPTIPKMETVVQLTNGEILAAGVISQYVQVWNVSTGNMLVELPGPGPVSINPDGKLLVYGDADGNLHTYNLTARQPIMTLYSMYASQLPVFSPDSRWLAAVNGYENHFFVRIWDTRRGTIVNGLGGPDAAITDLSFSLDGNYVVGAAGGSAWVWDVQPGTKPYTITLYASEIDGNLTLYHQRVTAAALSNDNRLVAIGDSERNVWLYNHATRGLVRRLEGHSAAVEHLRFSPDGTRLLSADQDGNIILWNILTGKSLATLATRTGPIRGLVFGLDGNLQSWVANTAWVLHPPDGVLVRATSVYSGTIFAASPAGDWLAVSNRLRMSVWDARTGKFGQMLEGEAGDPYVEHWWEGLILRGYYEAVFSPDGKQLTTKAPGETWVYNIQADNSFQLSNKTDWPSYTVLDEQAERFASSRDGFLSAATAQLQQPAPTLVLSNDANQEINRLSFPEGTWLTALAFSPDARLIAVGQADGSITLVDVAAWKIIATLTGHKAAVIALAFSMDGMTLASASDDGTVRFWGVK